MATLARHSRGRLTRFERQRRAARGTTHDYSHARHDPPSSIGARRTISRRCVRPSTLLCRHSGTCFFFLFFFPRPPGLGPIQAALLIRGYMAQNLSRPPTTYRKRPGVEDPGLLMVAPLADEIDEDAEGGIAKQEA